MVSIQLISPASGDFLVNQEIAFDLPSFHSINIPSEWGQVITEDNLPNKRVSIQLISPASGDVNNEILTYQNYVLGFHSINIPSEWGLFNHL